MGSTWKTRKMLPTRDLEKEIESHPANTRSKKGIGQDTRLGLVYSRVGTELDKVNLHRGVSQWGLLQVLWITRLGSQEGKYQYTGNNTKLHTVQYSIEQKRDDGGSPSPRVLPLPKPMNQSEGEDGINLIQLILPYSTQYSEYSTYRSTVKLVASRGGSPRPGRWVRFCGRCLGLRSTPFLLALLWFF